MRYLKYLVSFVIGGLLAWPLIEYVKEDRFISNAMNFAQIVGVFAGLGLTAISIMAALPLDGWITRVSRINIERKQTLVDMIKKTPDWFQQNLVIQIVSLTILISIALLFKVPDASNQEFGACRIIGNSLVCGSIVVSGHSMVELFRMMKDLLVLSLRRFDS